VAHGDDITDDVALAEGLHHTDQRQEDCDHTANQSDFYRLIHLTGFRVWIVQFIVIVRFVNTTSFFVIDNNEILQKIIFPRS